jgi:ubiquinone/menaquinone biosynthesis C-methylase UbiE
MNRPAMHQDTMHGGTIDKRRARQAFDRAAPNYDGAAFLQREIADRLLERLDYVRLKPKRVLDLGCGTGYATAALLRRYREARVIALDFARECCTRHAAAVPGGGAHSVCAPTSSTCRSPTAAPT